MPLRRSRQRNRRVQNATTPTKSTAPTKRAGKSDDLIGTTHRKRVAASKPVRRSSSIGGDLAHACVRCAAAPAWAAASVFCAHRVRDRNLSARILGAFVSYVHAATALAARMRDPGQF
mmetsp:Transcript_63737/g.174980  ORF Transcript_63737/g.174980 Transcript_63737/m.174980 type:complete len:118 (+) Transcript_63737:260-613(+)